MVPVLAAEVEEARELRIEVVEEGQKERRAKEDKMQISIRKLPYPVV